MMSLGLSKPKDVTYNNHIMVVIHCYSIALIGLTAIEHTIRALIIKLLIPLAQV